MSADEDLYKGVTVLIVEDEPTTRDSVRGQLRQMGIRTITEASDGKAGLAEVARTRPTLILCDGRQFLKMVRTAKVDWVKSIPIIFLTADANPETVTFAREFQVNGYLVKPISLKELKGRVDAVLKSLDRSPTKRGL
jgi:two-component system chemotaxis response regulator CheY